jgi:hypothetical protein
VAHLPREEARETAAWNARTRAVGSRVAEALDMGCRAARFRHGDGVSDSGTVGRRLHGVGAGAGAGTWRHVETAC